VRAGWGEVYRARDTKLGRDVAIKVLPEELSRDKERSERFEREARLLAQLNHQNIATLHGLEEHDGKLFLIMEVVEGETLAFQAGPETLRCTNLGELKAGSPVNLERSLKVSDRLGGHFVTGHVDAVGTLDSRSDEGEWSTCWFRAPEGLAAQMVSKGSIAVDGVSLTLVDVEGSRFSVALIPHTLSATTLGRLRCGDRVNLETDLLAKYVQQLLNSRR